MAAIRKIISSLLKKMKFPTQKYLPRFRHIIVLLALIDLLPARVTAQLKAGVAKADITDRGAGLVNDPLYVKALALNDGTTKMVVITLDVVAVEEIGPKAVIFQKFGHRYMTN